MNCIFVISNDIELINELIQHYTVVIINADNVNKYINKKIDILIIEENNIDDNEINLLCNNSKYILIQDNINLNIKLKKEVNVITFGFNHKSTVTISSINEEKVVICIQRQIKKMNNNLIEPQEIVIQNTSEYNINQHIIKRIITEILEK